MIKKPPEKNSYPPPPAPPTKIYSFNLSQFVKMPFSKARSQGEAEGANAGDCQALDSHCFAFFACGGETAKC